MRKGVTMNLRMFPDRFRAGPEYRPGMDPGPCAEETVIVMMHDTPGAMAHQLFCVLIEVQAGKGVPFAELT
jgi:hypothetical protein